MRVLFSFYLIMFCVETQAQCVSLTNGLVLDIPFSNGSITDLSGNNIGLTNHGATVSTDRCGISNSAYSFNGTSSYISLETSNLQLPKYTYSIWVKPNSNSIIQSPLSIGGATGGDQAIKISNSVIEAVSWDVGPHVSVATASPTFTVGTWYHVAMTRDNSLVKIYINGTLINSTSTAGYTITYSTNTVLGFIGARVNSDQYFNGSIDDIKVYDRVLCDAEIVELSNLCIATGVDEELASQINLYPNPSAGKVVISLPTSFSENAHIELINSIGQRVGVYDKQADSQIELDLTSLPTGLYECLISTKDNILIKKKVIINK